MGWVTGWPGPSCVEFPCSPRACVGGFSGFLPLSKNMHLCLICNSKLTLGVNVSLHGCLSRLSLCGPVIDWRVYPASGPMTAEIGSSSPTTLNWIKRIQKMDG